MSDNDYPGRYGGYESQPPRVRPRHASEDFAESYSPVDSSGWDAATDYDPVRAAHPPIDQTPPTPRRRRRPGEPRIPTELTTASESTAARQSDPPAEPSVGKHALPATPRRRKSRTLRRSVALTIASALLPGIGLLGARPRWARALGVVIPIGVLALTGLVAWRAVTDLAGLAAMAVDPVSLNAITVLLIVFALTWSWLVTLTHLLTRPPRMTTGRRALGALLVVALTFGISAPMAVAARYAQDQRRLVDTIFQPGDEVNATSHPSIAVEAKDPWADVPRLNILLLGADSTGTRIEDGGGVYIPRTDTIMVASIDTATGATAIIQIPRNLPKAPFPAGSQLAKLFPNGFGGDGDALEWHVNAIWEKTVNGDYPSMAKAVGNATYPGAEALKQGVEGITGLPMHYFMLVNIDGLQNLIDAMGGVRVNINQRLPIGGDHSQGTKPDAYLEPGPNQLLDGYHAMWYARSRYDSDDYARMARQSCLVNAVIDQANPTTLITQFEGIAAASSQMVMTDIPQEVLQPLVGLALRVKDADVTRIKFAPGEYGYDPESPNFKQMRAVVAEATGTAVPDPVETSAAPQPTTAAPAETTAAPTETTASEPTTSTSPIGEEVTDACAYNPVN